MKEIQQFFKKHSDRKDVFQTSDGTLFFLECDAKNHAATLEQKAVKKFLRDDTAQKEETAETPEDDIITDPGLSLDDSEINSTINEGTEGGVPGTGQTEINSTINEGAEGNDLETVQNEKYEEEKEDSQVDQTGSKKDAKSKKSK